MTKLTIAIFALCVCFVSAYEAAAQVAAGAAGSSGCFQKDFDCIIAFYKKEIEAKPSDVRALIYRGNAYQFKREYDKAIADYTRAISLDPRHANAHYNRGHSPKSHGPT